MYQAAKASEKFSFKEYLIIGIPATLWPLPSYKAEEILQIHNQFVKSSDDETAKLAFRVSCGLHKIIYIIVLEHLEISCF